MKKSSYRRMAMQWIGYISMACSCAFAGTKQVGDIADRFIIPNYDSSQPDVDLHTYAGKILVIDFWAYWCGYCPKPASEIDPKIRDYYQSRGGNESGIEVEVLTISIDNSNMSRVESFINTYNPPIVGLSNGQAWNQFGLGGIPHLTVINCAAGADSHAQYEVVYNRSGYSPSDDSTLSAIRNAIDSVTQSGPDPSDALTSVALFGPEFILTGTTAEIRCVASFSGGATAAQTPIWTILAGDEYASISLDGHLQAVSDGTVSLRASFTHNGITKSAVKTIQVSSYSSESDFQYSSSGSIASVTNYIGSGGEVRVPRTLSGLTVSSLANNAFENSGTMTDLLLPDSITSIGTDVFDGCTALLAIHVDGANVSFSSDDGVLFNKNQTTLLQYPKGKEGPYTIPASVYTLQSDAFNACALLTEVTIGPNVSNIGSSTFYACYKLTAIHSHATNPSYSSVDGVLLNKNETILQLCPQGKSGSYTMPESVIEIAVRAFAHSRITELIFGSEVKKINDQAFFNCRLPEIIIPDSVTNIGTSTSYSYAFAYCYSLNRVSIGSGVNSIGGYTFSGCAALTNAVFSGNAPAIFGNAVFDGTASTFSISYYEDSTGFTTPTWQGYPCTEIQRPDSPYSFQSWIAAQQLTADEQGWADCPAGDGIENIWKYAFGLPAKNHCSKEDLFKTETTDSTFSLTYRISKNAVNTDLTPEWKGSLAYAGWQSNGLTTTLIDDNPTQTVWKASLPLGEIGYIRLKASVDGIE